MLFHTFHSQEERRNFGGSYFVEFQYCKSEPKAKIKKMISFCNTVKPWQNDSLYIHGDDIDEFFSCCKDIFTDGIYDNGQKGTVDLCGINYYSAEETERIIKKLEKAHFEDKEN